MDLLILMFLACFIFRMCIIKEKNNYLDIEYTKYLRGILALIVIFCHIQYNRIIFPGFKVFNYIGDFAVSIFFFLSGYGVFSQYKKKGEKYLDCFFKNRIVNMVIIYIIFNIIYLIYYFISGRFSNINDIFEFTKSGELIVSHSWYIIDIIMMYILFWISAKIFKNNYNKIIVSMIIFTTAFIIILILIGTSESWVVSIMSMIFGMFYKNIQKNVDSKNKTIYYIIAILSFSLFEILQYIISNKNNFLFQKCIVVILKNFACISFAFMTINVGRKIQFKNPAFKFIGTISLELYLIHGLFEKVFSSIRYINENSFLYGLCVLIFSILSSYIIYTFCSKNIKAMYKRSKE